jgi:hypothetical protein
LYGIVDRSDIYIAFGSTFLKTKQHAYYPAQKPKNLKTIYVQTLRRAMAAGRATGHPIISVSKPVGVRGPLKNPFTWIFPAFSS